MAVRVIVQLPEGLGPEGYDRVAEQAMADGPPRGLILHSAGDDGSGNFTVVDIWESEDDLRRFEEERLLPAIVNVVGEGADRGDRPAVTELHNLVRS